MVGEVPDVTDDDGHQDAMTEIREHAQESLDAIMAQYRFVGLLAGIRGPNDTRDDVQNARDAVFEALSEVFSYAEDNSISAMRDELDELRRQTGVDSYNNKHLNAALFPGRISDLHLNSAIAYLNGTTADPGAYTLGSHLQREEEILMDYLARTQNVDRYHQYFEQHELAQRIIRAEAERRRIEAENYRPWYQRIWDFLTERYNAAIEQIRSGQWLVSLANFTISAALAVAEEIVINALVAAIVALTAGVGALLYGLLRGAVSLMLRVARTASRTFQINVHKVRRPSSGSTFEADVGTRYNREVDVETDLTDDEVRAFGEGGQGSTRTDADEPEVRNTRLSNGAVGELAEQQALRDLREQGYTDQRVIQNPQGNGVDVIARNPDTGEVVFGEVKANGAVLSPDQRDMGGPAYVRDRLERTINRQGEWSNATPQQQRDAREALRWLDGDDVEFREIKYDVDPETGEITNYRERTWDYEEGERPRQIIWRNEDGDYVTASGEPRAPPRNSQ